jgi:tetratricopeptide (TPR) repeat protein
MEVLEEIERKRKIDPELGGIRDILILNAQRGLSFYSVSDQERVALRVLNSISSPSPEVACRSALYAARIASDLRSHRMSQSIRQTIEKLPINALSPRLRAMRDLALAMAVYHVGEYKLSLSILRRCIDGLPDLADSTGVSLYSGIGAICSRLGDYSLGRQASQRAMVMAQKLGNDQLAATANGNLAVQSFRLGEYATARDHAITAYRLSLSQPTGVFDRIRGSYFAGMAEALGCLGGEQDSLLNNLVAAISSAEQPWHRQFGYLYLADLYLIRGHRRPAINAARQGIQMSELPLTSSVSGTFARWLAILAARSRAPQEGLEQLLKVGDAYASLDLLDCAELDGAVLYVMARIGVSDEERALRLRKRLAALPLPVSHQLSRLGVLASGGVTNPVPEAAL